jgi:hypothetical protein
LFFQIQTIETVVQRKVRDLPARSKLERRQNRSAAYFEKFNANRSGVGLNDAPIGLLRSISPHVMPFDSAPVSVTCLLPFSREQKPNLGAGTGLPNTLFASLGAMQYNAGTGDLPRLKDRHRLLASMYPRITSKRVKRGLTT